MLMGYGGLNLPTDVAANEYLNFKGQEFSKSRNWAVWLPDYLERYEVDPLRYYLASTMPETSDSDFTWEGFVAANNNELVATFGNFVHRVLTLTYRNFDGKTARTPDLFPKMMKLLSQPAIQRCPMSPPPSRRGDSATDCEPPWVWPSMATATLTKRPPGPR